MFRLEAVLALTPFYKNKSSRHPNRSYHGAAVPALQEVLISESTIEKGQLSHLQLLQVVCIVRGLDSIVDDGGDLWRG